MASTFFLDDYQEIIAGRASSYRPRPEGGWLNSSSEAAAFGSSSLFSTVDDMAKWLVNFDERSIGSDRVWEMMLESGTLNDGQETGYGFGLSFGTVDGRETVGHGGSWAGTVSQITYFPKERFGYVFVANRDPFEVFVEHDLCRIFLDGAAFEPSSSEASVAQPHVSVDPAIVADYVGWYRSGDDLIKVVGLEDGLAAVLLPWELTFHLRPLSDTSFRLEELGATYVFRGPQSGIRLWAYYADRVELYDRMQTEVSALDDVEDICGEYYSEELSTTYPVEVRDGQLAVTHPENEAVLLARLDRDRYLGDRWWFTEVRFLRDGQGKVSRMLVDADQGSILNLRFVKR
jgi:hypothetical protein